MCPHVNAITPLRFPLNGKNSYYQAENKQSDIFDRVFLIIWINAFNSCKTRRLPLTMVGIAHSSLVCMKYGSVDLLESGTLSLPLDNEPPVRS